MVELKQTNKQIHTIMMTRSERLKAEQETPANTNEMPKPTLNFAKVVEGGEASFFKFDKNTTFVGRFLRILPDDYHLEGIEFREYETEKIYIVPTFATLMQYFSKKEPNESVVFQIVKTGEKEVKKGRVFLFDIYESEC